MVSRRRFLAGFTTVSGGVLLAGCNGATPEIELVQEAEFELTERDLIHSDPTLDSTPEFGEETIGYYFESRSEFEDVVVTDNWPDGVDRTPFDETEYGDEFVIAAETGLTEDGTVSYSDVTVNGDRLLYDVAVSCADGPITRLHYRFQRWRYVSGNGIVEADPAQSCDREPTVTGFENRTQ
jgi:hypothetical protein